MFLMLSTRRTLPHITLHRVTGNALWLQTDKLKKKDKSHTGHIVQNRPIPDTIFFPPLAGVNFFLRKMGNQLTPELTIKNKDDHYTFTSVSTFKTTNLEFDVGKEFETTTPDGRKVKVWSTATPIFRYLCCEILWKGSRMKGLTAGGRGEGLCVKHLLLCVCILNTYFGLELESVKTLKFHVDSTVVHKSTFFFLGGGGVVAVSKYFWENSRQISWICLFCLAKWTLLQHFKYHILLAQASS